MRKIYIAGPMTGLPDFNKPAFHSKAAELREEGFTVLNPAILPDGLEHHEYMQIWMEHDLAMDIGLSVIYQC